MQIGHFTSVIQQAHTSMRGGRWLTNAVIAMELGATMAGCGCGAAAGQSGAARRRRLHGHARRGGRWRSRAFVAAWLDTNAAGAKELRASRYRRGEGW